MNKLPAKAHYGGKPRRVTAETVARVADRVAQGMPLRYALALENPACPLKHWERSLGKRSGLARLFEEKIARFIEAALQKINSATCKTLPGECWTLERRLPEFFSTRSAPSVSVTVNTAIGLGDGIAKRAAGLFAKPVITIKSAGAPVKRLLPAPKSKP